MTYDVGDYEAALQEALRVADVDALRAEQARRIEAGEEKLLGIGVSTYVEITGFGGKELGSVRIEPDGSATVMSGTSAHGQGHATSFAMIVADRLGIPIEQIRYVQSDTRVVPTGGGTGGSRSLQLGGSAVAAAAAAVRDQARELAAQLLEAAPEDLELTDAGFTVSGVPGAVVDWPAAGGRRRGARHPAARPARRAPGRRDVPVRRARVGRRGRHRDRPGGAAAARRRRRLRPDPQPGHRRGAAARRDRAGHLSGPVGAVPLLRGRPAAHLDVRRLPDADRGRHDLVRDLQHRDPDPSQRARRQGHRRVRDDRLHSGGPERRGRRAAPPRRPPRRHPVHARARVAGRPGRPGRHPARPVARASGGLRHPRGSDRRGSTEAWRSRT